MQLVLAIGTNITSSFFPQCPVIDGGSLDHDGTGRGIQK